MQGCLCCYIFYQVMYVLCLLWPLAYAVYTRRKTNKWRIGCRPARLHVVQTSNYIYAACIYVRDSGAYFLTVFHISLFDKNVCFLCILEFKIFWGWRKSSVGESNDVVASSKDQSLCDIHYVTKIFCYTIYKTWILMNLIVHFIFLQILFYFVFYCSVSMDILLV